MFTGDLSDFALRDVLQFLAATTKSGLLRLRCADFEAGVFLHDGDICLALLDLDRLPGLAARLIRAGLTDLEQLRSLCGTTGDRTAFGLATELGRGIADQSAASAVIAEHTRDTIGWLYRSVDATFDFERMRPMDGWPFPPLNASDVIAEVEQREGEWSEVLATVGDLTLVGSLMPESSRPADISLSVPQWRVIALIDGRRTVKDLVELSGIGHLETCRQLQTLVAAGLVELVAAGDRTTLGELVRGLIGTSPLTLPGREQEELVAHEAPLTASGDQSDLQQPIAMFEDIAAPIAAFATSPEPGEPSPMASDDDDRLSAEGTGRPTPMIDTDDPNLGLLQRLIGGQATARP